jgi:hypothetical protein
MGDFENAALCFVLDTAKTHILLDFTPFYISNADLTE